MSVFPETPVSVLAAIAARVTGRSDESAWTRLFELYEPAIRRFAEGLGGGDESEDIAQEIFLKLVEILRGGRYSADEGRFRSYLATLIRHELVSRWRRRQARGGSNLVSMDDGASGVEPAVDSETAAVIDAKWRLARRQAAVEHTLTKTALAEKSKAIYRAYVVEGRPIDEVAALFGVSNNVVSQTKTRIEKMIVAVEAEYGE